MTIITTHKTNRFEVKISDVDIELTTEKGVFRFGVDNNGEPYISTRINRLMLVPSASNRVNILQEGKG